MKKFENYAANENNPNWDKIISRQSPLYNRNNFMKTTIFVQELNT